MSGSEHEFLSAADKAKLREMLTQYYAELERKSATPAGIPARLFIADDIVSQAIEPLQAENAALRQIAEAVAKDNGPLVQDTEYGYWICGWCEYSFARADSPGDSARLTYEHAPDCPVTNARALLAADGESEAGDA